MNDYLLRNDFKETKNLYIGIDLNSFNFYSKFLNHPKSFCIIKLFIDF